MSTYYIGEVEYTTKRDWTMKANVFAKNIKTGGHTGKYEDLIHKLSPTVKNLSRSNQTSGATPTNQASGSITFSVKKSGYKPVAIMGYDTSNATESAGISRVGTSGIWLNYSNQTCTWSWMVYGKTSQTKRQYKVKVVVLYIKANDNDEPA